MSIGNTKSQEKSHTKRKNSNHEHSSTKRNKTSSTAVTSGKYFKYISLVLFYIYILNCFMLIKFIIALISSLSILMS